jgi:hypothetical protein
MAEVLTAEQSKALFELCPTGRFYDVEKWIASGQTLRVPVSCKKSPYFRPHSLDRAFATWADEFREVIAKPRPSDFGMPLRVLALRLRNSR